MNRSEIAFDTHESRCTDMGDAVVLAFTAQTPRIGPDILDAMHRALDLAERRAVAMVVTSHAQHFALGADLDAAFDAATNGHAEALDAALDRYQRTMLRLRHASVPSVAAVRGAAISGGCEVLMHCTRVVLHPHSAVGLMEASVGVLPAGGGVKEFALRAARRGDDLAESIITAFETLSEARLARSADDAVRFGYLDASTMLVEADVVEAAIRVGRESLHRPPSSNPRFRVAGPDVAERIIAQQREALTRGAIDAHRFEVNARIASVLCGGDAPGDQRDEVELLALERAGFIELFATRGTQELIARLRAGGRGPSR